MGVDAPLNSRRSPAKKGWGNLLGMLMMMLLIILVNICDDDGDLVIKIILVKGVMSCDVSPVAIFVHYMMN